MLATIILSFSLLLDTGGNYIVAHQDVDDIIDTITLTGCDESLFNETK